MLKNLTRYFLGAVIGLLFAAAISPVHTTEYRVINMAQALPDRVLILQDVALVLQNKKCESGAILAQADPSIRPLLKGGFVQPHAPGAEKVRLCYLEDDGQIGIVDEQGRSGVFPSTIFAPAKPKVSI